MKSCSCQFQFSPDRLKDFLAMGVRDIKNETMYCRLADNVASKNNSGDSSIRTQDLFGSLERICYYHKQLLCPKS